MRSLGLPLISFGLTGAVVANAYYQKKQFYPSVVYITKSNSSMAVIYIQALILVILAGKLVKKIFFGQLRAAEFEHLMERSWYAVTETCLAFTVFKDDFSPKFVALFILLLFLKAFHWLTEDRVDFMERSPMISYIFHIRVTVLLVILGLLDIYFVLGAYHTTMTKGASVMIVFGFEYIILLTAVINIATKYLLHTIDLNREIFWENKAVFFLYMELVMSFVKAIMYVVFVLIMMRVYTMPLFAFRPMYYAARSFRKALKDVINSRRAIHHLNNSFPDATPEELSEADNVCIICREEMQSASKKLPCNHIFHTSCLRSWFQRHQTCPTCRTSILDHNSTASRETNAPQQPAPGPQPGVIPPFAFPFNPLQMPFPPHNQPPAPPQSGVPPQHTPGVPPTASTSGTLPNDARHQSSVPPFPGMVPPSFMPSMMPFMAYGVPPPMPPPNFTGLTEEQLREMEINAREGVEARLRCLHNIQVLLDAATFMLQQYSVSAANVNIMNSSEAPSAQGSSEPGPSAHSQYQNGPDLSTTSPNLDPTDSAQTSKTSPDKAETNSNQQNQRAKLPQNEVIDRSQSSDSNVQNQPSSSNAQGQTSLGQYSSETEEQKEIRLRRIQKFASAAISSSNE